MRVESVGAKRKLKQTEMRGTNMAEAEASRSRRIDISLSPQPDTYHLNNGGELVKRTAHAASASRVHRVQNSGHVETKGHPKK